MLTEQKIRERVSRITERAGAIAMLKLIVEFHKNKVITSNCAFRDHRLWHTLVGSTPPMTGLSETDLPGESSIGAFLDRLEKEFEIVG